jgi:hypothetical protein
MVYWSLMHILTFFLDFFKIMGIMDINKGLEIILLRQQGAYQNITEKPDI